MLFLDRCLKHFDLLLYDYLINAQGKKSAIKQYHRLSMLRFANAGKKKENREANEYSTHRHTSKSKMKREREKTRNGFNRVN